ncbi:carboxypeptidase-like regulatory domain-containing protein [Lacinutrix salivirga]
MKLITVKQLIQLALTFACFVGFSQQELKNIIIDEALYTPIENASIYVQNTTIGTVSNVDGKFTLVVPEKHAKDTLIVSSIGYKSFKVPVNEFDNAMEVFLESEVASLDEVVLIADPRPTTGNDIVVRAINRLPRNMPDSSYIQKGFLRHKERNKKEFKWLIESAISVYDSSFAVGSKEQLKINVDQVRKSYDLRDLDSLFSYSTYLRYKAKNVNLKAKNLRRDTIETASLIKAIKWNDTRVNGLENLFKGKLNLVRNAQGAKALFGDNILSNHQFKLDTILVDNGRKLYKIEILKGEDYVGLNTEGIYNEGFNAQGWIYIYYDNYAFKKIEYELIAASKAQKSRSKTLYATNVNHKLVISYREYNNKMYPNYIYYETPKLVNVGFKPKGKVSEEELAKYNNEERYYYTVQEILFTEIILDQEEVNQAMTSNWDPDIFSPKPYDKDFWKNYNTLLESEEDEKLINDLTKRSSLFKE